jgi:hypothetical protein
MNKTQRLKTPSTKDKEAILDYLRYRRAAYEDTFVDTNAVRVVLTDLATFCRAGQSTFDPDPRTDALLQGRKEVWLRIAQHLGYTEEELYRVFALGKQPHNGEEE